MENPGDKHKIQGLLSARGELLRVEENVKTERSTQRRLEDQTFTPVIIKRTDEARIHPDDILERAISEGSEQLKRPVLSLFLSSMAAGLILGFSAMAVSVVSAAIGEDIHPLLRRIGMAFFYPLGFVICIMSGTQLFTEHTATAVYPVLDGKHNAASLLRLWVIVIVGNLSGSFLSSWLISSASQVVAANSGYLEVASHLVHFPFGPLLISSILAGWLMAQGAWILLATPPQSSQIISIYLVTFLIGVGGFHHSIAGSAEIFTAALISQSYGWADCVYYISSSLLGNLMGGSLFVAILNYAHIRKTQEKLNKRKRP